MDTPCVNLNSVELFGGIFFGGNGMQRGAIFDMDGTIFDTERFYVKAWIEVADLFGVQRHPSIGLEMSGTNQAEASKVFATHYPQLDAKKYFDKVVDTVAEWSETKLEFLPGAKEILDYFKTHRVLMSVASGSPRRVIERNLHRSNIREYFVTAVGGDEIVNGKPEPDIFLKAAAQMNLSAKDCYVFEDSFNGIIAAYRAGCVPVMIPNQREPSDEIRKLCAGIYKDFFAAIVAIEQQKI